MGIPQFYRRWVKKIDSLAAPALKQSIQCLAIDANALIHETAKQMDPKRPYNQKRFFYSITDRIRELVNICNPSCLIFAIDGMAPGGKLNQQRVRRLKAQETQGFDSNAITPGTEFMFELDTHLQAFFTREFLAPTVIYSSHLVPGEGEHKIMDYFRKGRFDREELDPNQTQLIYGADADLIMLSLLSDTRITIMRYDQNQDITEYLDIEVLKDYLRDEDIPPLDFVTLLFLLGNDYLPISPSMVMVEKSIPALLELYKQWAVETESTIVDTTEETIVWENVLGLLSKVVSSRFETKFLSETVSNKKFSIIPDFYQDSIETNKDGYRVFKYEKFRKLWYEKSFYPQGPSEFQNKITQFLDLDTLLPPDEQIDGEIGDMVTSYFKTWEWVLLYYRKGMTAVNQDWCYPYFQAPVLTDLLYFEPQEFIGVTPYPGMLNFSCLHQLLAVIPPTSKRLLPPELLPLLQLDSPIYDLFGSSYQKVALKGAFRDYELTTLIPPLDRERIVFAINSLVLKPDFVAKWLSTTDFFFHATKNSTINDEANDLLEDVEIISPPQTIFRGRGRGNDFRGRGRGNDFRGRGQDRTDFRGRGRGNDFRGRGQDRTDFRGRGQDRTDFRGRGQDRTDFRGRDEKCNREPKPVFVDSIRKSITPFVPYQPQE